MGIKKKIFVGLATIAITMGLYGYREYIRKNKNLSYVKANFKIQANAFIKEFEENEKKANEKFLDKIIAVSGAIRDVIKDDKGYYSIVLSGDENMSTVRCSMNSIDQDEVGLLHFTNAIGMNERIFLSETTNDWGHGDIQFGFNLSRTFQLKKKK